MLLSLEKSIRGEMCHAMHWYARANNKYMKYYTSSKECSYLMYWNVNNLYGWTIPQKLPVDGPELGKDLFRLNGKFIQNFDKNSDKGIHTRRRC